MPTMMTATLLRTRAILTMKKIHTLVYLKNMSAVSHVRRLSTSQIPPKLCQIGECRYVAYRETPGSKQPGIIFLPGYMSNMKGDKALALENFCREHGHSFVRFDYEGLGESPGQFKDVTLGHWKQDILAILDNLTSGPQLLVGSSLGGWLMLLVALERPERIHSLVGIGTAVNFTTRQFDKLPEKIKGRLENGEEVVLEGPYGEYIITKKLIEESKHHMINVERPIPVTCPVRLLHGMMDTDVPYQISLTIGQQLASTNVDVILRRTGQHRMSEPQDLELLLSTIDTLIKGKGVNRKIQ